MITFEEALTAREFHHTSLKRANGEPCRVRRNGKTKTWKREPSRFRIPVKYGLKQCFYIEPHNAHEWEVAK